jgi:hypothetical protein
MAIRNAIDTGTKSLSPWPTAGRNAPLARIFSGLLDASASCVRHHIGEPYTRKNQDTRESRGGGVQRHAMPILVVAFRAFIFCEVWDG